MRLSTILLGIEGLIEQWRCKVYFSSILFGLEGLIEQRRWKVYFSSILFGLEGLIEQRRYIFLLQGVVPEVVDCGIAEGEQDGVEGEALERILLTRQQRVQAYATNRWRHIQNVGLEFN